MAKKAVSDTTPAPAKTNVAPSDKVQYKVERAGATQTHAVVFSDANHRADALETLACDDTIVVTELADGTGAVGHKKVTTVVTELEPGDKVIETIQPKPKKDAAAQPATTTEVEAAAAE